MGKDMLAKGAVSRRGMLALLGAGGAAAAGQAAAHTQNQTTPARFTHGVACGDPTRSGLVIWTRAVPETGEVAVLDWQVAVDPAFHRVVADGQVQTTSARDYTAKVEVEGLRAGVSYFYRFRAGAAVSDVGQGRTLPDKGIEEVRFAVLSCSHYGFGYFNAYRALAERKQPLDAVIHLGDYIYEYGVDGYGGPQSIALGRQHQPAHELVTLADYRQRFAQYRSDPDLQALHARAAFITVWDDHETANNSWVGGASIHDPETEGRWEDRRDAALKAYFEWMPMRDPKAGEPLHVLNRTYDFGDIASLMAIETRLTGRMKALSATRDMVLDANGQPDVARFEAEVMNDPSRSMMGPKQEAWLEEELKASKDRGVAWQMLANQTIVARMRAPDFLSVLPEDIKAEAMSRTGSRRWLESTRLGLPINFDAWDGYPAARLRLYDSVKRTGARLAVLTGDTHMFWGNRLHDPRDESPVGVEFGVASVTSPGGYEGISPDPRIFTIASEALVAKNPDVQFAHVHEHGFLLVTLRRDTIQTDYVRVPTILERTGESEEFAHITVNHDLDLRIIKPV